jgi:lysophospholipase L1-like esterase
MTRSPCFSLLGTIGFSVFAMAIQSARGQDATPTGQPMTIYPVGDSITAGYGPQIQGGYRAYLYQKLKDAGIQVQLIGTSDLNSANPILTNDNQTHHEGHGGYRIDQIFKNLNGLDPGDSSFGGYWMTGGHGTGRSPLSPDIILVHVGTNDIIQKGTPEVVEGRLQKLLDYFALNCGQAKIFVAKILPINRDNDNDTVKALNSWVEGKLADPSYANHFYVVDMYSHFVDPAGHINHLPDGIHPDTDGYRTMANVWYQALMDAKVFPSSP